MKYSFSRTSSQLNHLEVLIFYLINLEIEFTYDLLKPKRLFVWFKNKLSTKIVYFEHKKNLYIPLKKAYKLRN